MTVREASEMFHIDEKEVRKNYRARMIIGAANINGKVYIPDDTTIIPNKKDIQSFLFQILQKKNNKDYVFSRKLCPDRETLFCLVEYLYRRGFIGEYKFNDDVDSLLETVMLTSEGLEFVMGSRLLDFKVFELSPVQ